MRNLSEKFYNRFIEILKVTIPERGELYKTLEEILCKEKMSIYRRLKGEVPFTFPEIITISHELNISLDEIINVTSSCKNLPFTMFFRDYSNLSDAAYKSGEDYVNAIKVAANEPDSEYGYAADILPLPVIVVYPPIFRLFMMKWQYQFGNVNTMLPYSEIVIPERLRSIQREFIRAIQNIKYTYFIYHEFALAKLIHDVQYFKSIRLMTDEDADLLKESLYQALLVLENLSISGTFDTGNKIDMYVSGVSFETSYSYLASESINISRLNAFVLEHVASSDIQVCYIMKKWMQSIKRTSTIITHSEKNRIEYLEKQRRFLEEI